MSNVQEKSVNTQKNIRRTCLEKSVEHSAFAMTSTMSKHNEVFPSSEHSSYNLPDSSPDLVDSILTKSSNSYSVHECLSQTTFLDIKDSLLTIMEQPFETSNAQPNFSRKINKNTIHAKRKFSLKKKIISALMTSLVFNSLHLMKNKNSNNIPVRNEKVNCFYVHLRPILPLH
jgi:hypothetical protein